jgi:DNA ligase-associated metallophosphoesterase
VTIQIADQTLRLVAGGGALLSDGTLVVADLHLGKASAFQARGLAIPEGDSEADLHRLTALAKWHQAERLIVNGDLFHSPAGLTDHIELLIERWLDDIRIPVEITYGNHDRKLPRIPHGLAPAESKQFGGFHIAHDPEDVPEGVCAVTAHWHPVAKIADGKRTALRLPCFLLRGSMLVLPAFGSFTGGQVIEPEKGDRYFVSPAEEVVEVPGELIRG